MRVSTLPEHPPVLTDVDRDYLVAWGRKELLVVRFIAGLVALLLAALTVYHSYYWALFYIVELPLAALLILFFRNPTREVPTGPGLLVAPADGTVTDVSEVEEAEFIGGEAIRIGIFLSILDVHVNRAPASGRVEWVRHREGAHHDARRKSAALENESNTVAIVRDDPGGPAEARLLVKQISGAIARRIICPLEAGDVVARGGLIGMIKYGSRTELYVSAGTGVEVRVKAGDKVNGGATVVAAWPSAETGSQPSGS